jgi:long-chain acyl-CoA synthetase
MSDATAKGGQSTIDESAIPTIPHIFNEAVRTHAAMPALESFGKRMTYARMGETARAVTAWLQAQGFVKGDRIALMMPNVMAYPPLIFGALAGGYVVVNVNPLYTPRELTHQLKDSGARALFVLENFGKTVEETLKSVKLDRVVVVRPGDLLGLKGKIINFVSKRVKKAVPAFSLPDAVPFAAVMSQGSSRSPAMVEVTPDDLAFLQYTGGTTGVSKGAMLLHRNVGANVVQVERLVGEAMTDLANPIMITALPLYHIYALNNCCIYLARAGGMQVLIANPRDLDGLIATIKDKKFNSIALVNTLYAALVDHPRVREIDFSGLRLSSAGGMATQAIVARKWKEISGRPIIEGYGLSETSPVVASNRTDITDFTGTVGFPVASTQVSIRDANGEPVADGEPGELCVKGPQVMAGYWNRPDETAKAMTADGFFKTGDVAAVQPDGSIKIVDRIKDMILVSGFNVFPNEIEDVLATHPKVAEVAVVGMADAKSGESVRAIIVPRDPSLTRDEIIAFARENLTAYKVPKRVDFRDALPKTNVGKILRRELRD